MSSGKREFHQNGFIKNYIIEEPLGFEPDERGLGYLYFTSMKRHKNKIAQYLADTQEEDTYDDFLRRTVRTALELRKRDLSKDDVVCLCSYNHKNSVVPFVACNFLGVRVASLDPLLSLMDTEHLVSEVKPKIIFVVPEALKVIETSLEKTGLDIDIYKHPPLAPIQYFALLESVPVSFTKMPSLLFTVIQSCHNKETIHFISLGLNIEIVLFDELGTSDKHTNFSEFLQFQDEEETFIPESVSSLRETAVIFFSSGTTGLPKGIETNHYALICQSINFIQSGNLGNVSLSYTSLYWISSVLFTTAAIFTGNARVVCPTFNPKQFWQLVERYKVTNMAGAPSQAVDIIKAGRPDGLDTTSFVSCMIGGATMSKKYTLQLRDLLPGTFVAMAYGQTEVTGLVTTFQIKHVKDTLALHYKPESVGRLVPGMTCKVVDFETEKLCGPNETGELMLKTPMVMNGYYGRDSSESFDADGWLKTGDVVYYDEEKFFYIVDRIKEMLKYRSWHVAPAVVEKIVLEHPAVQRVVVIGIPHEEDGDHPMAVVVLNPEYAESITEEDIQGFVAEKAPDRMRLRGGVKFVSSIPITPSGKMKRKHIRDMVMNGSI